MEFRRIMRCSRGEIVKLCAMLSESHCLDVLLSTPCLLLTPLDGWDARGRGGGVGSVGIARAELGATGLRLPSKLPKLSCIGASAQTSCKCASSVTLLHVSPWALRLARECTRDWSANASQSSSARQKGQLAEPLGRSGRPCGCMRVLSLLFPRVNHRLRQRACALMEQLGQVSGVCFGRIASKQMQHWLASLEVTVVHGQPAGACGVPFSFPQVEKRPCTRTSRGTEWSLSVWLRCAPLVLEASCSSYPCCCWGDPRAACDLLSTALSTELFSSVRSGDQSFSVVLSGSSVHTLGEANAWSKQSRPFEMPRIA